VCSQLGAAPDDDAEPGGADTTRCARAGACAAAVTLGSLFGDSDHAVLAAQRGSQGAWFRVRVRETDNADVQAHAMRLAVQLTSPPGAGFDVVLHAGPEGVDTDTSQSPAAQTAAMCDAAAIGTTTLSGAVTQVRAQWGESAIADGVSNTRDVAIEVRPRSEICPVDATWQLVVEGNWK
jgi:hypothetical protein